MKERDDSLIMMTVTYMIVYTYQNIFNCNLKGLTYIVCKIYLKRMTLTQKKNLQIYWVINGRQTSIRVTFLRIKYVKSQLGMKSNYWKSLVNNPKQDGTEGHLMLGRNTPLAKICV